MESFMEVRAVLGGNVIMISTGSAPIRADVIDFIKIAFGCEITEGMQSNTLHSFTERISHTSFLLRVSPEVTWPGVKRSPFFSDMV